MYLAVRLDLVGIGFSDVGVLVLALLTLLAWLSFRRPSAGRMLAVLAPLYLMALGVAWVGQDHEARS